MNRDLRVSHSEILPAPQSGLFPVTLWSMIQCARQDEEALQGLDRLARAYWRPLHVFALQYGLTTDAAEDAVQGFFEHLISHDMLQDVQRGEVRFRSFLLRCFTNWLLNERKKSRAAKRGGDALALCLDEFGSRSGDPALVEAHTPGHAFDRSWARSVVDQALMRLDEELAARDRASFLQELRSRTFAYGGEAPDWEAVAARHDMSHGAVRKAAADLRRRFGAVLREEVRRCVSRDEEVDEELRYLMSLLSRS